MMTILSAKVVQRTAAMRLERMAEMGPSRNMLRRNSMRGHTFRPITRSQRCVVLQLRTLGNFFRVSIDRKLMKIRVSRPRREFGLDGHSFIERDAGESNVEIKITKTGYFTKKKVLEMGL